MKTFLEFFDRKERQAVRHLGIVKKLLESNGISVQDYRNDEEPYLYALVPAKNLSFDGIRIYWIGNMLAYRVQRENRTHPYGKAYPLNLEEMFSDYMSENIKEDEAGKKVIEGVVNEVKKFFQKSLEAEKDVEKGQFDFMGNPMSANEDPLNKPVIRSTTGTDYSSQLQGWTFNSSSGR